MHLFASHLLKTVIDIWRAANIDGNVLPSFEREQSPELLVLKLSVNDAMGHHDETQEIRVKWKQMCDLLLKYGRHRSVHFEAE